MLTPLVCTHCHRALEPLEGGRCDACGRTLCRQCLPVGILPGYFGRKGRCRPCEQQAAEAAAPAQDSPEASTCSR